MFEIVGKENLAPEIDLFTIDAPLIAAKAQPGHFVIARALEIGERIPLTIVDYDRDAGTIDLVVQAVGSSTTEFCNLEVGDGLLDLLGPLGEPIEIKEIGTIVCVAGGLGVAPVYPKAKYLKEAGNKIISIVGAQTEEMIIMKDKMEEISDEIYFSTDDGSLGKKGFTTDILTSLLTEKAEEIDEVVAVGPAIMMKAASEVTADYNLETIVSLNPIMIDGTGMCGGCRVTVDGETLFACVDGPVFDGHAVDFDELMMRQNHYQTQEEQAKHDCKIDKEVE